MNHFYIKQEHDILKNIEFFVLDRLKRIIGEFKLRVKLYGIPTQPWGGSGGGPGGNPPQPPPGSGLGWNQPGGSQPPPPPPPPPGAPFEGDGGDENDGWGDWGGDSDNENTTRGFSRGEPEPHHPEARSSTQRTTEDFASVLPSKQQFPTEEGNTQAREQEPDTRRTVERQGDDSFKSLTEHFDISSPSTAGLINIGSDIFVKREDITDEDLIKFVQDHATYKDGEDLIMDA